MNITPPEMVITRGDTLEASQDPASTARRDVMKYPRHPPTKTERTGCVPARRIVETWERSPHSAKKIIRKICSTKLSCGLQSFDCVAGDSRGDVSCTPSDSVLKVDWISSWASANSPFSL